MQSALAIALLVSVHLCPAAPPSVPSMPPSPPRLRSGTIGMDDYPVAALRAGAEGIVELSLTVDANGRVSDCAVTASAGHPALDSTTCSLALRRYRFSPATRNGQPVESTYNRRVRWRLPPSVPAEAVAPPGEEEAPRDPGI